MVGKRREITHTGSVGYGWNSHSAGCEQNHLLQY
jgi:hypothetical protein